MNPTSPSLVGNRLAIDGEIELVRGLHGRQTHLATLTNGALISEAILLDECFHSVSAFARRTQARVIQIPRAVLDDVKASNPDLYYRIVARVAQRISARLRAASELLASHREVAPEITSYRTEHDSPARWN